MKKKSILLFVITISIIASCYFFIGCNKDTDISLKNNYDNLSLKSLQMNTELAKLYEDVPTFDFGKITLINGDILRFESVEQYCQVYEDLLTQCEAWSDIFFNQYDTDDEDKLDLIIDTLGFDECTPLLLFEQEYGIIGNNLRAIWVENENTWLEEEATGTPPIDEIVNCPTEQTLYSQYHEVCIGDTIYQMRSNGCQVIIPIKEIEHLPEIRAAVTMSDLEMLLEQLQGVCIIKSADACYNSFTYISDQQYHPEVGEKKFTWSYRYGTALLHRCKTTVTMANYKKKNGKWRNDYTICALALKTRLYNYMTDSESCLSNGDISLDMNTPSKHHSRTRIKYTRRVQTINDTSSSTQLGDNGIIFYPQIEIEKMHTDPTESYIQCRHQGWSYQFNAETGNLE